MQEVAFRLLMADRQKVKNNYPGLQIRLLIV